MVKVLYGNEIFAMQKYGGISRYFSEMIYFLNKNSPNTNIGITKGLHRNHYLRQYKLNTYAHPLYCRSFKGAGRVFCRFNKHLNMISGSTHADIYHSSYYHFPNRLPTTVQKVLTVYDMIHEFYPDHFAKNDKTAELKATAIHKADHIFAISNTTKRDLMKVHNLPASKITVTYLGVDHIDVEYSNREKEGADILLHVGPRDGYKNFTRLIDVFSRLLRTRPDAVLVAFGGGKFTEKEKNLFNKFSVPEKNIKHVAGSDDVLMSLYRNVSIFIYPSIYEGFGIPPLEAMAKGCPVVASNTPSVAEVVGSGALLFHPEDPTDMLTAIELMLNNKELRDDLIAQGYERIKEFTWRNTALQTLEIYERLRN